MRGLYLKQSELIYSGYGPFTRCRDYRVRINNYKNTFNKFYKNGQKKYL